MTTTSIIKEVALGLGALAWWDFIDTRIAPDRMRSILASEGQDPTVVQDINQRNAVARAVREWHRRDFRAELAHENATSIVVGILHREKPATAEVRWVQVDRVVYDLTSNVWTETGATPEAGEYIADANKHCTHLDHQWLRPWLQGRLDAVHALPVKNRSGGFFFVAKQFLPEIEKLQRIVGQIGSCSLSVAHVEATVASQQAMAGAAVSATRDSLDELRARLDSWRDSARKVRDASAEHVLVAFADLKSRCDLYADALEVSLEELQAEIKASEEEARKLIGEVSAEAVKTAKVVKAKASTVSKMTRLINGRTEAFTASTDEIRAAGFSESSSQGAARWQGGPIGAAAATLGWTVLAKKNGSLHVTCTPSAQPEQTEPEAPIVDVTPKAKASKVKAAPKPKAKAPKAEEAKPEADAPKPKAKSKTKAAKPAPEDQVSDLREKLATLSPDEVTARYVEITGVKNPKGIPKATMIEEIVSLAG